MKEAKELFITGLRNAHAMESQAHEMLERQIERMDDYPELQSRLKDHFQETKSQLKRLEQCLDRMDSSPSTVKDTTLAFGANIAAMGHAMAGDEVLKNAFANSGLEAYEIAAYKSLLKMADVADSGAKQALEQSLREEENMAHWLLEHVDAITAAYMQRQEEAAA